MADDPLDDLSTEEKQALANLVQEDTGFELSRRDVIALAGGASLGTVLATKADDVMGSAKADASTSDSDGNVGTPNDLVDVFAEGIAGGGTQIEIGDSLVPDTNASYDLGGASSTYKNAYLSALSGGGSAVDIADSLVPDTDASYDLGSASNGFNNAYISNAEVESVNAGEVNNEVEVTTESELDTAIANSKEKIRIKGTISVSGTKSYAVKGGRIYGYGSIDTGPTTGIGDALVGDVAGPILDLGASAITADGFSVINTNSSGVGVEHSAGSRVEGKGLYISSVDKGWNCTSGTYESLVTNCRIRNNATPDTGTPLGSVGVDMSGSVTDTEVNGGFVIGYDTAIARPRVVDGVHTYGTDNMSIGVDSPLKVVNSYIEGSEITDANILVRNDDVIVSNNHFKVGQGADGVAVEGSSSPVYGVQVTDNNFQPDSGSTPNTPVTGRNVTAWNRCKIEGNTHPSSPFSSQGVRTKTTGNDGAGGIDLTTTGQYTETISHDLNLTPNPDDVYAWVRGDPVDFTASVADIDNTTDSSFDIQVNVSHASSGSPFASVYYMIDASTDY